MKANSLDFKKGLFLLSSGKIWPKNTTSLGKQQKTSLTEAKLHSGVELLR